MTDTHRAPEILPGEVVRGEEIGSGSFGKVYKGVCRGKAVAIKMLHKPITDAKILNDFKREVHTMSSFQHPNICLFMGACTQPGNFFIVSEFLPGGDVESLLADKTKKLSLFRRLLMAKDAALGMNWLHCMNPAFIHRDLKTSNLLIDENGKVKVCDFGLSESKNQGAMLRDRDRAMGTPLWMAPEVMMFQPFNEKVDVYSFGIVLWEIVTRQAPFPHHTEYPKFREAVCQKHERPPMPSNIEPTLGNLIQRCWHADPNSRPSFASILEDLDNVLVHVGVSDPYGRAFWKHHFLGVPEAPWDSFYDYFCQALKQPTYPEDVQNSPFERERVRVNMECFKALLAVESKGADSGLIVTLERFGDIMEWFGPITHPDRTPANSSILDKISDALKNPWFHGDLDEKAAGERLAGKPEGTFLVRFSSQRGFYTISVLMQGRTVKHWRIEHRPGSGYTIDHHTYATLHQLLYERGFMEPNNANPRAAEGSRFQHIFKPQAEDGGYVNHDDDYMEDLMS